MITADIAYKLENYFSKDKYDLAHHGEYIVIEEKDNLGRVELNCQCKSDSIYFKNPDKNVLPYLDSGKKNATSCPDGFVYKFEKDNRIILYVLEHKKSINNSTLSKLRIQVTMGIYYARAISSFLNFDISEIVVITAFRNAFDRQSTISMRVQNSFEEQSVMSDWENDKITLNVDSDIVTYSHQKCELDEKGAGNCML